MDEYLEWQHLGTRMNCAGYFQQVNTVFKCTVLKTGFVTAALAPAHDDQEV